MIYLSWIMGACLGITLRIALMPQQGDPTKVVCVSLIFLEIDAIALILSGEIPKKV